MYSDASRARDLPFHFLRFEPFLASIPRPGRTRGLRGGERDAASKRKTIEVWIVLGGRTRLVDPYRPHITQGPHTRYGVTSRARCAPRTLYNPKDLCPAASMSVALERASSAYKKPRRPPRVRDAPLMVVCECAPMRQCNSRAQSAQWPSVVGNSNLTSFPVSFL